MRTQNKKQRDAAEKDRPEGKLREEELCMADVAALEDLELLHRITTRDEWKMALCAYQRLADLGSLPGEPADGGPLVWIAMLQGPPVLRRVGLSRRANSNATDYGNRTMTNPRAAIFCLRTEEDLRFVIDHDERQLVRIKAVQKCRQDGEYLLSLALNDADDGVRMAAAKRIRGEKAIETLLEQGRGGARCVAAKRTKNLALLKAAAIASPLQPVNHEALKRVDGWTILEIVAVLGHVYGYDRWMARQRFRALREDWKEQGHALLAANQRLFADAAINDPMMLDLTIELFTDEACIADILCGISPHMAGVTEYGPIGEARWSGDEDGSGAGMAAVTHVCSKVKSEEQLRRIAGNARTRYIRGRAAYWLTAAQNARAEAGEDAP